MSKRLTNLKNKNEIYDPLTLLEETKNILVVQN